MQVNWLLEKDIINYYKNILYLTCGCSINESNAKEMCEGCGNPIYRCSIHPDGIACYHDGDCEKTDES